MTDVAVTINSINCSIVGEQINVSLTPTNTNIQLVQSLTIQGQSLPFGGTRGQYLEKTGDGASEIAWKTSWMDLVRGYNSIPLLHATIADGDVYRYTYDGGVTYYRLVPSGAAEDAFYASFSEGNLSGLVAKKKMEF
jgi:hypothetical protein